MTLTIRHAMPADMTAILMLQAACPRLPQWSPAVWQPIVASTTDTAAPRHAFCIFGDDVFAGFAVLAQTLDIAEIETLAIGTAFRRQGVATTLLVDALISTAKQGATRAQLEVRSSNAAARRLYASLGFVEENIRRDYYHDPTEDALLLSAKLPLRQPAPDAKV